MGQAAPTGSGRDYSPERLEGLTMLCPLYTDWQRKKASSKRLTTNAAKAAVLKLELLMKKGAQTKP
jgi:hypothetical protein